MTFDEFMRYVRRLANQGWVRYYLHILPGRMVLEFASAEVCLPKQLNKDLMSAGFEPHIGWLSTYGALHCYRWSVKRDEAEVRG